MAHGALSKFKSALSQPGAILVAACDALTYIGARHVRRVASGGVYLGEAAGTEGQAQRFHGFMPFAPAAQYAVGDGDTFRISCPHPQGGVVWRVTTFQAIAEEAGFEVRENRHTAANNGFYYVEAGDRDDAPTVYPTALAAWEACCRDNRLLPVGKPANAAA